MHSRELEVTMKFPEIRLRPGARRADATPPRLILHAGSPKTGTTAIQFALSENRPYLESVGVSYPRIDEFFPINPRLSRARAHFAFANAVADDTPGDRIRIARFLGALRRRSDRAGRIILSAETLYRLTAAPPPGTPAGTPLDRRLRYLERLAGLTRGFDTEILLYLRRVDRFAASLYAESVVQTDTAASFQDFLKAKGPRFDYRRQIDHFARHFPVRVHSFEATAQSGLIQTFCGHAGIAGELPPTPERPRPSVSNAAVLWLRRAKLDRPDMAQLERNHRWHFALRPENAELFQRDERSVFWTDRAERDAFIAKNQADVTEVDFPEVEDTIAPLATWSDTRHEDAERRFFTWRSANQAMLRYRKRKRIPPYVLET